MPISKEDAQKLLQSRNITDETYNSLPLVMDPNQMSTDSPAIDASAIAGQEQAGTSLPTTPSIPGIIAREGLNLGFGAIKAGSDSAQFQNQQSIDLPVFDSKRAEEAQQQLIKQNIKAKKGAETIGEEQKKTAAPVSKEATEGALGTTTLGTDSAEYTKQQMQLNDQILGESEKALTNLRSKIAINPNRLMEKISADGKGPMTTIALVLGGIGAGLTGQPNAAQAILEKRIQQDIDAQQTSIKNYFEQEAQVRALSKEVRASAGENVMAKAASQAIVLSGYKAAIENVLQNVTDKTAVEKAQALMLTLDERIAKATLDYDNIHKANIKSGSSESSNLLGAAILGYTNNLGLNIGVPRQTVNTTGVRSQYGLGITQPVANTRAPEQPKKETPKKEEPKKETSMTDAFLRGFTKQIFGPADK
jgi:hypothetical protein